jgi:hypothetical protein
MDRQYIRDNGLVERYLQGRLTADEAAAFEEAYVGDAELLQELEAAALLRRGFAAHDAAERSAPAPSAAARSPTGRSAAAPRYALAASLVAGVALAFSTYLFVENGALRGGGAASASSARLVPLVAVRGGEPNRIGAASTDEWTVLLLDPGFTPYDEYRATVVRRNGAAELLSVAGLTPSYEGLLAVVVSSRLLTPGDYDVVLAGRMRDWPAQRAFDDLGRTALTVTAAR